MSTESPARRWYGNATALRRGKITVEQARAVNAAMRAELGEAGYDAAKRAAMASMARGAR